MPKATEHIVIIGGTSGIGLAIAQAAHSLGCLVTIGGRDGGRAASIAASISPQTRSIGIDLTHSDSIQAALAEGRRSTISSSRPSTASIPASRILRSRTRKYSRA